MPSLVFKPAPGLTGATSEAHRSAHTSGVPYRSWRTVRTVSLRRFLGWSLLGEAFLFVVLAITGAWLAAFYRPTAAQSYRNSPRASEQVVRVVHNQIGHLFVLGAVGILGLAIAVSVERARPGLRRAWVLGFVGLVLAVAMSFTGYLLPWDQLALKAVTVGSNWQGLWRASFSPAVRFVLIGGVEVGQGTLRTWFLVHALLLPVIAGVMGILIARAKGSFTSPQDADPGSTAR